MYVVTNDNVFLYIWLQTDANTADLSAYLNILGFFGKEDIYWPPIFIYIMLIQKLLKYLQRHRFSSWILFTIFFHLLYLRLEQFIKSIIQFGHYLYHIKYARGLR